MADTRSQILDAARQIFEEEGKDAVSMRKVASEVGISAMAIYRHFTDKQALLTAVVESGFANLEKHLQRGKRGRNGEDALLAMMDEYVRFALAEPQYYDAMFLQPRPDMRRYPEDFAAGESTAFNVFVEAVRAAIQAGELGEDDPLEVTLSAWAHIHGLVSLYRSGRFGEHPRRFRQQARQSLQRLFDGLRA